ncbi:hypothetical protein D9619_009899 [Psilocybe cf. subviscida]|uniref:MICOS complex subunit MIC12 n=1 Tax=Psilocybe cf. subviscida TaxID=2480587 RepID=A0A8H5BKY4_9AGAR|nr:hypothetical protein D9619_009899 [Psilocybe cf. subviscida]
MSVYYGFSNLMQTRTEQHIRDLRALSVRLVDTPTLVLAPTSAAARIKPHPLASEVKAQWNDHVSALFTGVANLDKTAVRWGQSLLYGPPGASIEQQKAPSSPPASPPS